MLLFEDKIPGFGPEKILFKSTVKTYANTLGIQADWLMALMMHESGLNSKAINSLGCVGLIQFCPIVYQDTWGITKDYLLNMSAVSQLQYVYKYLKPYAGKMKRPIDVFLAAFYPYALIHNKLDDLSYKFGSEKSEQFIKSVSRWNPGFDLNKNDAITSREYICYHNKIFKQWGLPVVKNVGCNKYYIFVIILVILLVTFFVSKKILKY